MFTEGFVGNPRIGRQGRRSIAARLHSTYRLERLYGVFKRRKHVLRVFPSPPAIAPLVRRCGPSRIRSGPRRGPRE